MCTHGRTHTYTNACTTAQSSCKPFNAATQWGSVSNAALDFLAWKQRALCWCFTASFNVLSRIPSCKNNLWYILKYNHCYPISVYVLVILVYFCFISDREFEWNPCPLAQTSSCSVGSECGMFIRPMRYPRYISHDYDWPPSSWLAIHHGLCQLYLDPETIHRSPV